MGERLQARLKASYKVAWAGSTNARISNSSHFAVFTMQLNSTGVKAVM